MSTSYIFTKHGLHLNESGKELLSKQLVLHKFSILEEVSVNPITLGWYDKNPQVNASSITRPSPTLTPINCQLPTEQAPKCTKKLPVTRKDDFFKGNLTEGSEFGRVINCNEFKHNMNQNHVRNLFIPKFSKKDFVIFHQNIRGLKSNKLEELSVSLSANPPHTICFTKHHLGINEIDTILLANYRF